MMELSQLLHLEDHLRQRADVRDDVLQEVARAIRKGMSGLRDPRCPIATFVFLGSSGIVKEQLAQALAATLFGDAAAVIRITADPLARAQWDEYRVATGVRLWPSSVIVFDEMEAASRATQELFLQIRDEGRTADTVGGFVEFKDTILMAWSSVGARRIAQYTGPGGGRDFECMKRDVADELQRLFAPEFLRNAEFIIVR
jgi:ATP-dependent Clp protease ATP-binding subunit ClpA